MFIINNFMNTFPSAFDVTFGFYKMESIKWKMSTKNIKSYVTYVLIAPLLILDAFLSILTNMISFSKTCSP